MGITVNVRLPKLRNMPSEEPIRERSRYCPTRCVGASAAGVMYMAVCNGSAVFDARFARPAMALWHGYIAQRSWRNGGGACMRTLIGALAVAWATVVPFAGTSLAEERAVATRWARGIIEYRVDGVDDSWGSERWHMSVHPDGSRTMQTVNEIPSLGIQRSVTLRVARSFRPLELAAIYYTDGQWRGTGLFAVDGDALEATVETPAGTLRESWELPGDFAFIPHPLATDAWAVWQYDKTRPAPQQRTVYDLDSGARSAASMMGRLYSQDVEYLGMEEVTTPAGTFMTDHFRISDAGVVVNMHLIGPDYILAKFTFRAAGRESEFVLTELEIGED